LLGFLSLDPQRSF